MAARAVCRDGAESERFAWFCDQHRKALAISTIDRVRQVVSDDRLVSEFEVTVGAVPFVAQLGFPYSGGLPLGITGCIRSTADLEQSGSGSWRLLMDAVEVRGSNLPLLRALLDGPLRLQTRELSRLIAQVAPDYSDPRPEFRTTFLDATTRVSRDQDGNAFVYVRTSDATEPTDFSGVRADLGLGEWLESLAQTYHLDAPAA